MALFKIGGYRWSAELVAWGSVGAGNSMKMSCYSSKRGDGNRGSLSANQISTRTVNVSSIEAVYALFHGTTLIYIGEGNLGSCMVRHCRDDEFVGRWDSFTWLSPCSLSIDPNDPHNHSIAAAPSPISPTLTAKQLIEHIETIAIRLSDPIGNRQNPDQADQITWLTQLPPANFLTQEERLNRTLEIVELLATNMKIQLPK